MRSNRLSRRVAELEAQVRAARRTAKALHDTQSSEEKREIEARVRALEVAAQIAKARHGLESE